MTVLDQSDDWLPLFPLNAVLFPDGVLPLRVFEARYVDMVRERMKGDSTFGVVRITSGNEIGTAAQTDAVGCLTRITNWDVPSMGMLMLRTVGTRRFRILESRVRSDQRLEARVEFMPEDPPCALQPEEAACVQALRRIVSEIELQSPADVADDRIAKPFEAPFRYDDAGWIANRWCELLPLPLPARQQLMELDDPHQRLSLIRQYLQEHGIVTA